MTNFNTPNFEFYSFDKNSEEHQKALFLLEEDPLIKRWFGNFGKFFYSDPEDVISELNGKFLVGKGDDIIGFVSLLDCFKYVNLDYGLLPNFRGIRDNSNLTIGSKLLLETSDTILKNNAQIEFLRCYIDLNNIRSISAAKKAGFVCHREIIAGYGEYRKSREL